MRGAETPAERSNFTAAAATALLSCIHAYTFCSSWPRRTRKEGTPHILAIEQQPFPAVAISIQAGKKVLPHTCGKLPEVGIEPTRSCPHRILSPARLPVSPLRLNKKDLVIREKSPFGLGINFDVLAFGTGYNLANIVLYLGPVFDDSSVLFYKMAAQI